MRKFKTTYFVMIATIAFSSPFTEAQDPKEKVPGTKVRVGTFDSRALAMAYYRSVEFNDQMKAMHEEHAAAKSAGDENRVDELETKGPALQELIHKQGFGTWPVDNILKKIKNQIPEIATKANVDIVVSKWDIAYQRSGAEFIDVTDLMVKPFDPDKKTLQVIEDIRKQAPVPNEQLNNHDH